MITYLYIADTYNSRLVKRLASDLSFVSKVGSLGSGNDQFNNLRGVATDGTHLYIADSLNHRIVKRLASDLSYVSQVGSLGIGNDQFNSPESIAISGSYLYILDTNNHRLVKRLASDLSYVSKTGTQGTGPDQFYYPRGIATDGTHLYIADTSGQRIKKHLVSDLSYVSKACTLGTGNDQVQAPEGVTVSGSDLFVGDTYNNRVVKRLASDLSYRSQVGSSGTGNDQFYLLCRLANDGTYLYVGDTYNNRVVKRLLSDLSYVSRFGSLGTGNDQFNHPYSIAVGVEAPAPPPSLSVRPIAVRSYWKRFMARNPNYKGRLMEIYEGQVGMKESEFKRTWVGKLTNVTTQSGEFTFESTDLLKDLSQIDVPPKLDIKLATELSDAEAQQITLTSVVGLDAVSGYIRIKDEIIGYAAINAVTKALQTLTRGAFGTVAAEYKAKDKVQKVRYYAPANPWDLLLEMLRTDAGIADAYIDIPAFNLAKGALGSDLLFRAVVSEPTKLDKLFFEITDLLDAKPWQGEDLRITIQRNVLNAPGRTYYRMTDGENIVDDSASVDFNEKSRLTRMLIYWHKSVLGKIDDPAAFDRLDIAVDAEAEASYGDVVEKKVFCRWLDPIINEEDSAEAYIKNLGMRQVWRSRDAQPLITLSLSLRDLAIKTGDHVRLDTDELVKFSGDPIANEIFQVVKRDLQDDFSLKVSLLRVAGGGGGGGGGGGVPGGGGGGGTRRIALIAPAGYPNYPDATDAQREYGFITLDTGLMANEDEGYYIW